MNERGIMQMIVDNTALAAKKQNKNESAQIKKELATKFPELKFSCRVQKYAGGQTLHIEISNIIGSRYTFSEVYDFCTDRTLQGNYFINVKNADERTYWDEIAELCQYNPDTDWRDATDEQSQMFRDVANNQAFDDFESWGGIEAYLQKMMDKKQETETIAIDSIDEIEEESIAIAQTINIELTDDIDDVVSKVTKSLDWGIYEIIGLCLLLMPETERQLFKELAQELEEWQEEKEEVKPSIKTIVEQLNQLNYNWFDLVYLLLEDVNLEKLSREWIFEKARSESKQKVEIADIVNVVSVTEEAKVIPVVPVVPVVDYKTLYKTWIDKLVVNNRHSEIKSYEQWLDLVKDLL